LQSVAQRFQLQVSNIGGLIQHLPQQRRFAAELKIGLRDHLTKHLAAIIEDIGDAHLAGLPTREGLG
jgi:hypothetical protein